MYYCESWLRQILELVDVNVLNRSMGHEDAYPFVLTDFVKSKLKYIDEVINTFSDPIGET